MDYTFVVVRMNAEAIQKLIQLSKFHYAKYCRNLLAQGRSENQVKNALAAKVGRNAHPQSIDDVFRWGRELWLAEKNKSLPVIVATKNGNS